MPAPTYIATQLDPEVLAGATTAPDEPEGLGAPDYRAIKDAIASGVIDPSMTIPLPIPHPPVNLEYFLSSLRAFELKPGGKYVMFVPEEIYERLAGLLGQLQGLPWGGMILPGRFYGDGEVEILVGTLEQHLGWLDGNKGNKGNGGNGGAGGGA